MIEKGAWKDGFAPHEDLKFSSKSMLRIDGQRFRYEVFGERYWSLKLDRPADRHYLSVYDGHKQIQFLHEETKSLAVIRHEQRESGDEGSIVLQPITLAFWPRSQRFQTLDWDALKISPKPVLLDNKEYILGEVTSGEVFTVRKRIWLDAEKDFVPRRFQAHRLQRNGDEILIWQVDFDYAPHSLKWMLASWDLEVASVGRKAHKHHHGEILEISINPQSTNEAFDVVFPGGTKIKEYKQ